MLAGATRRRLRICLGAPWKSNYNFQEAQEGRGECLKRSVETGASAKSAAVGSRSFGEIIIIIMCIICRWDGTMRSERIKKRKRRNRVQRFLFIDHFGRFSWSFSSVRPLPPHMLRSPLGAPNRWQSNSDFVQDITGSYRKYVYTRVDSLRSVEIPSNAHTDRPEVKVEDNFALIFRSNARELLRALERCFINVFSCWITFCLSTWAARTNFSSTKVIPSAPLCAQSNVSWKIMIEFSAVR